MTLSYGSGPKSAPLDLLLFDSHCWDCADSGECTAKTKRPECIFAAGSQHIQIFRLGRTATPTQNINKNPGKKRTSSSLILDFSKWKAKVHMILIYLCTQRRLPDVRPAQGQRRVQQQDLSLLLQRHRAPLQALRLRRLRRQLQQLPQRDPVPPEVRRRLHPGPPRRRREDHHH